MLHNSMVHDAKQRRSSSHSPNANPPGRRLAERDAISLDGTAPRRGATSFRGPGRLFSERDANRLTETVALKKDIISTIGQSGGAQWRPGTITPSPTSSHQSTPSSPPSTDGDDDGNEKIRFFVKDTVSPGVWYTIHLIAADGKFLTLIEMLDTFVRRFTCPDCSVHMEQYFLKHPVPNFKNLSTSSQDRKSDIKDDEDGKKMFAKKLFIWSCEFHNSVSERIGKPTLTRDDMNILFQELTTVADEENIMHRYKLSQSSSRGHILSRSNNIVTKDCIGCSSPSHQQPASRSQQDRSLPSQTYIP